MGQLGKVIADSDTIKVWIGSWGCFAISQAVVIEWIKLIPLLIAAGYTLRKWVIMERSVSRKQEEEKSNDHEHD